MEKKLAANAETNKQVEDPNKTSARKEEKNEKKAKKNTTYIWLKKYVAEYEKGLKLAEKEQQEAKKAQAHKVMNSPLLNAMVDAKIAQHKKPVKEGTYNFKIYKRDDSWSGYFKHFLGYPTKIELDPENPLTQALLNSYKYEAKVDTDGDTGETYLAIVDKPKQD